MQAGSTTSSVSKQPATRFKRFGTSASIIVDRNRSASQKTIDQVSDITKGPFIADGAKWLRASAHVQASGQGNETQASGGSAANTAYIVSTLMQGLHDMTSLGAPSPVWLHGTHAGDNLADLFKKDLKNAGIQDHTSPSAKENAHTGTCMVLTQKDEGKNKGERHMFTAPGVSNDFTKISDQDHLFENLGIYEVENYGLAQNEENFKENFKKTHENGGKTLLTLANKFITAGNRDLVLKKMIGPKEDKTGIDTVVGNEEEISTLISGNPDTVFPKKELLQKAQDFAKKHKTELIVTMGKEGSATISPEGHKIDTAIAPAEQVVDTTGAGDSYLGGVIAARLAGLNDAQAAEIGAKTASIVVAHKGSARPPKENFTKIIEELHCLIQSK